MWTRVNPECMFFKNFRGKLFKNGKRYAKSETTIQKLSRRGFQIISYMFNLNVKQALANQICCSHYMCIITCTQNNRKCQNASKCLLRNGTKSNDTSSYILLHHSNAFGLSGGNFLSRTSLPEPILSGERGGWIFNYSPFWGPLAIWLDQTGTCTTWLWGLQYKTIIGSLWYLATEEMQ